jgi:predicted MFS family arabinose efflux permease
MLRSRRAALLVIALNYFILTMGFNTWQSLFNNFAVDELHIRAEQIGLVQSIREIPGLLGFLVSLLALFLAEMRIAGLSVVLMGLGIWLTATVHGMPGLIGATLLMSTGFHFFSASNASAVLLAVDTDEAPRLMGRLNSIGALATALGTVLIFGTLGTWGYRTLLAVTGGLVFVFGALLLPFGHQPRRVRSGKQLRALRGRYWLYYALQFLWGSRRHIFTTFAIYLLVKNYAVSAQAIAVLSFLNSLIGTYLHQALGKMVARFGERRVLTVNFVLLAAIFIGYALVPQMRALHSPPFLLPALALGGHTLFPALPSSPALLILLGLFVADNVLFGFSIALECYLQRIAVSAEDITPNVSLGQTINHIAAVIIPVVGGVVWATVGPRYTFITGVVIALAALVITQWMQPRAAGSTLVCPVRTCPSGEGNERGRVRL